MFQSRTAFPKVARIIQGGQAFAYGPNVLMSDHDEWRKHRRIAGPSFVETNNVLVWESTIGVILGYFTRWNQDGKGRIIQVPDFTEVATQIAYMVFSTAGVWTGIGIGPRAR